MKKLKRFWRTIPRPLRALIDLLAITAVSLALYTFIGAPAFSPEQAYRRAEKAHMVGPGNILCDVDLESGFPSYQRLLVAETDRGVILYCYDHVLQEDPMLIYREKTQDVTVLTAPAPTDSRDATTMVRLPVFVFDDCPEAVRAELDLGIITQLSGGTFQKTYQMEAQREGPGYFRFTLDITGLVPLGAEGHAIQRLILLSGYGGRTQAGTSVPATVRLYDAQDNLIESYNTSIQSVVDQAHQQKP